MKNGKRRRIDYELLMLHFLFLADNRNKLESVIDPILIIERMVGSINKLFSSVLNYGIFNLFLLIALSSVSSASIAKSGLIVAL